MPKSKVAVLKTQPETVVADYQRLMEMAEFQRHLDPSRTTILKDNISWHFPFPGANTTPWQLEGTILGLHNHGYRDVVCVQNKTVVTDAFKGEDLNKYMPIFRRYHIPVLYNFKPEDMKWVRYEPKAKMLVLDQIYRDYGGIQIPDYFVGKNIIHLPTVKCHIYTTTTGAIKNAFGGLLNTLRHYTHSWIHETIVDLLAIQKEIHSGLFAVMDGTTCGNGPGPRTMIPVVKNLILASADQVAIDAVAAKMMGFDPMSIKYINLAHETGLGIGKPEEIEIVGAGHLTGELAFPRRRQPRQPRRRPAVVQPAQADSELLLPHAAGERLHLRLGGVPRLLPLAAEGPQNIRELAARPRRGASCSNSTPQPTVKPSRRKQREPIFDF